MCLTITMNCKDRKKLQANYSNLLEVMYSNISPYLISKFILDPEMHAEIETGRTDKQKMEKLLALLPTRGSRAMMEFIKALKPNYNWLAKRLEEDDCGNNLLCVSNNNNEPDRSTLRDIPIQTHLRSIERILQRSFSLCKNWTSLPNSMNLKPSIIMDIKRDMALEGGLDYAIHATLDHWIAKQGLRKASFRSLIHILEDLDLNDVAENLLELWINNQ